MSVTNMTTGMMSLDSIRGSSHSTLDPSSGEVGGVCRVVWVGSSLNLDMPSDWCRCCRDQANLLSTLCTTREHPPLFAMGWEVPVLEPFRAFVRVSAFGPSPHLPPNLPVHRGECILTAHMSVIIRPTPYDGIKLVYHHGRLGGDVPFENASDFGQ